MLDTVRILIARIFAVIILANCLLLFGSCRQACENRRQKNYNISTNKQQRKSLFEFRKNICLFTVNFYSALLIVLVLLPLFLT